METPLVSVVIVTWNRRDDLLITVQSVYDQSYRPVEIIVVDNGSTDGTVEAVRRAYPEITLVALDHNSGAAAGRNAGIARARGELVFILDSDASLDRETLSKVVGKFGQEPDLGVSMCKILNASTRELDQTSGWIYPEKDKVDQNREFPSYSFSECGAAIRKRVLDQVGAFWDLLFFVGEGDELSLRIWDAGYKIVYWPEAIVYHRASPQHRVVYNDWQYFDLRNSLYIHLVRYPWWMIVWSVPLQIAISLLKGLRRGCTGHALRALRDVGRQLPDLWRQRRPISNETARRYLALQRQRGPLSWDLVSWLRYKM